MTWRPRRPLRGAGVDDEVRQERLSSISAAIDDFAHNLARLLAGHPTTFGPTVSAELAAHMQRALRPFLDTGERLQPDFGHFAELHIEGDLLDVTRPVQASLEFDDRSFRQNRDGARHAPPLRRVRLLMRVALEPCRIEWCDFRARLLPLRDALDR